MTYFEGNSAVAKFSIDSRSSLMVMVLMVIFIIILGVYQTLFISVAKNLKKEGGDCNVLEGEELSECMECKKTWKKIHPDTDKMHFGRQGMPFVGSVHDDYELGCQPHVIYFGYIDED